MPGARRSAAAVAWRERVICWACAHLLAARRRRRRRCTAARGRRRHYWQHLSARRSAAAHLTHGGGALGVLSHSRYESYEVRRGRAGESGRGAFFCLFLPRQLVPRPQGTRRRSCRSPTPHTHVSTTACAADATERTTTNVNTPRCCLRSRLPRWSETQGERHHVISAAALRLLGVARASFCAMQRISCRSRCGIVSAPPAAAASCCQRSAAANVPAAAPASRRLPPACSQRAPPGQHAAACSAAAAEAHAASPLAPHRRSLLVAALAACAACPPPRALAADEALRQASFDQLEAFAKVCNLLVHARVPCLRALC